MRAPNDGLHKYILSSGTGQTAASVAAVVMAASAAAAVAVTAAVARRPKLNERPADGSVVRPWRTRAVVYVVGLGV